MLRNKILIAEDREKLREGLAKTLKRNSKKILDIDLDIDKVESGEEAINLAQRKNGQYGLIIMDGNFGEDKINGIRAIEGIRSFDRDTPICYWSGENSRGRALKAGANYEVSKSTLILDSEEHLPKMFKRNG